MDVQKTASFTRFYVSAELGEIHSFLLPLFFYFRVLAYTHCAAENICGGILAPSQQFVIDPTPIAQPKTFWGVFLCFALRYAF